MNLVSKIYSRVIAVVGHFFELRKISPLKFYYTIFFFITSLTTLGFTLYFGIWAWYRIGFLALLGIGNVVIYSDIFDIHRKLTLAAKPFPVAFLEYYNSESDTRLRTLVNSLRFLGYVVTISKFSVFFLMVDFIFWSSVFGVSYLLHLQGQFPLYSSVIGEIIINGKVVSKKAIAMVSLFGISFGIGNQISGEYVKYRFDVNREQIKFETDVAREREFSKIRLDELTRTQQAAQQDEQRMEQIKFETDVAREREFSKIRLDEHQQIKAMDQKFLETQAKLERKYGVVSPPPAPLSEKLN